MPVRKRSWSEKKGIDVGTGTGRGIETWTEGIMKRPAAHQVAALEISHGIEACAERWWYLSPSTLRQLVSEGKREMRKEAA